MRSADSFTAAPGRSSFALQTPALRLQGVVVRYGNLVALDAVNLYAPAGSITAVIGRNGAGKSTAIRLLAGLLRPSEGRAEVLGGNPADPATRASVGYLLETPALFTYLTAEETLTFLAEAYRLPRPEADRRTGDLLSFFGLEDSRDRLVEDFSTGMRKRLALAAALIHSPRLLVLDEPFESLDPLMVRRLKDLLVRFTALGGSVLLSSHLIDAVEEISDRIAILDEGKVVVSGTLEQALTAAAGELQNGKLEELYAAVVRQKAASSLDWLRIDDPP